MRGHALLLCAATVLAGCSKPAGPVARADVGCPGRLDGDIAFPLAPSGAPEAVPEWLWDHRCDVRIIDVREQDELGAGMIPEAQHVALGDLEDSVPTWDPNQPIVFVCRSGRRSARAVEVVERNGFSRAASLTGGMLAWDRAGLPTASPERRSAPPAAAHARPTSTVDELRQALENAHFPQVRAASLLMGGFESCVDGREDHAVIGTPGGDLGELVLALSTAEQLGGFELEASAIRSLFDSHIEGFGRIYLHTDAHALQAVAALPGAPDDLVQLEAWVRSPPLAVRDDLLDRLITPDAIGCGHLKLVRLHPDAYGVRPIIVEELLRAYFKTLWSRPEAVEFVVLEGEHHEGGVIVVEPDAEVHSYTNLPAVPPILDGRAYFVAHPGATTFIRNENVDFFLDEIPQLAEHGIDHQGFERALAEHGARQSQQTLQRLGAGLPVYTLQFDGTRPIVRVQESQ